MMHINTILHPTDFSAHSEAAFHLACALARDHDARLVVLHAAMRPSFAFVDGAVPIDSEQILHEASEQLKQIQAPRLRLAVEHLLEEGDPITEILRAASKLPADLIVMGTHGRTGLGRLLMGSVAEQIVRKAPCPVITVKTPMPEAERELAEAGSTASAY